MANKKKEKKDLEKILNEYLQAEEISKGLEQDPFNYNLRVGLGSLELGDPNFYSETGADAVRFAADQYKNRNSKVLTENVKYSDLVSNFDAKELKKILPMLPVLEDGNSDLAKAHKRYTEVLAAYEAGQEMMENDPENYKMLLASQLAKKNPAAAYMARGTDESTRKVAMIDLLEAKIALYEAIDKAYGIKTEYPK